MDNKMLQDEFKYFKEHYSELFEIYPNKYVVIKDLKIQYSANTFDEALQYAVDQFELGTFIVQHCTEDDSGYTQIYHSRVKF